jgi:hypothetical protein
MTEALDDVKNLVQSFQPYLLKPIDSRRLLAHLRVLRLI